MTILSKPFKRVSTFREILAVTVTTIVLSTSMISNAIATPQTQTQHKVINVNNLDIFYREAGPKDAPTIVLLHGFPTSSHMFRNLIPMLADQYHVIAPDYPGYGNSDMPAIDAFDYSFDNLSNTVDKFLEKIDAKTYTLYVMDYGAPIGFRIAAKHPERVTGLIIQNGNAYEEGLLEFWDPIRTYWEEKTPENAKMLSDALLTIGATKWQYTNGARSHKTTTRGGGLFC